MGKKKRSAEALHDGDLESAGAAMVPGVLNFAAGPMNPPQASDGNSPAAVESYLVKKYRPATFSRTIDAFQKYTKTHRMLDATFVRVLPAGLGGTFCFWGKLLNFSSFIPITKIS